MSTKDLTRAPVFEQDAESYLLESDLFNRFWWIWLPAVSVLILPLWAYVDTSSYKAIFQGERTGVLELIHALFPLIAGILALRLVFKRSIRRDPLILAALIIMLLGCLYLAGEEASWGQHHFGWSTPDYLAAVNKQQETNIHNISPWANHIPRAVLITLIFLGGTVLPLIKVHKPQWCMRRTDFLYPPQALLTLAIIVVALEVLVQIGNSNDVSQWVRFHDGELQETYIVAAVLLYALTLWHRAKSLG